ncbi:hypothetical protein ABW19_dt0202169 [Dactylella cylindrospora]|nr:hypothetical protein ABW19_dt0202169 [Dactylella cylindrospora]
MADDRIDLHKALANLSPLDDSALPDQYHLKQFLESTFSNAAYIVDTLPIPPPPNGPSSAPVTPATRSRSGTVTSNSSNSSNKLTILPSPVRPPLPPNPSTYTKEWKEVKPGGANPHDIKVYKLASKDGNGAWFARRSVHEGIGFARFRKGLRREFDESLRRTMGVGRASPNSSTILEDGEESEWEGMVIPAGVRGIGAERRLERKVEKGVGRIDVYHLSAQFPGPSAPRDFVTACITSSSSAPPLSSTTAPSGRKGREFTMVSRPLAHPAAPEQSGFVRGRYESIEFIREIIPEEETTSPRRSMSVSDLTQRSSLLASIDAEAKVGRRRSRTVGEASRKAVSFDDGKPEMLRTKTMGLGLESLREHSKLREAMSADDLPDDTAPAFELKVTQPEEVTQADGDADSMENDEDGELNPVEWIMLTRSDPGGSVPRFMVERGTPGSIIKDAEKFLDWACEKVHHDELSDDEDEPEGLHIDDEMSMSQDRSSTNNSSFTISGDNTSEESPEAQSLKRAMSNDDSMSNLSFMTASSGEGECEEEDSSLGSSLNSGQINTPLNSLIDETSSINGRPRSDSSAALQRIQTDALKAAERAKANREKDEKKLARELAKEEERQRKLDEKHAREAAKREEKFKREQARAEEKRRREEEKIRERKRKLEERDEKVRNEREKEDLRREIELLKKEKDVLFKENENLRREVATLKARYEPELNGTHKMSPSRTSSQVILHYPQQRPESPASSTGSSKGRKKG